MVQRLRDGCKFDPLESHSVKLIIFISLIKETQYLYNSDRKQRKEYLDFRLSLFPCYIIFNFKMLYQNKNKNIYLKNKFKQYKLTSFP